jgi:hypothetical protein
MLFDNFELRNHYGDVGHRLLVQDAPSLIPKYMITMHLWSLLYLCIFKTLIFTFWPLPGLLVPDMMSASKNQYRQPRFRAHVSQVDAVHIWSKEFLSTKDNSCPRIFFGTSVRKQTGVRTVLRTKDFIRYSHRVLLVLVLVLLLTQLIRLQI